VQQGGEVGDCASFDGDLAEAEGSVARSLQEEEIFAS